MFGERRLRACRDILGWKSIDVRVIALTLDDLGRLLRDEYAAIAKIPVEQRVALAREYLVSLGVRLDDLIAAAEVAA